MTQVVDSPRAHKLKASGHGAAERFQQADVLVHGLSIFGGAPSLLTLGAGEEVLVPEALEGPEAQEAPEQDFLGNDTLETGDGLLSAVWRTSSYLESVQWELDAAQGSLLRAVQEAAHSGVGHDELCKAANITPAELAAALGELPPATPPL